LCGRWLQPNILSQLYSLIFLHNQFPSYCSWNQPSPIKLNKEWFGKVFA
jgi:hypothetical protein